MLQQPGKQNCHRKVINKKKYNNKNQKEEEVIEGLVNLECMEILRKNLHLQQQIRNLYGRHQPIKINPNFNFRQQWENILYEKDKDIFMELIQLENISSYVYTAVILIMNIVIFWYLSMHRFDSVKQKMNGQIIISIGLATTILDVVVKIYFQYLRNTATDIKAMKLLKTFKNEIYLIFYFVIDLTVDLEGYKGIILAYTIDLLAIYIVYSRAKNLFHLFKIRSYTSSQRHKMKLLDLLGTLLLFLHIFALLLYVVSFADPTHNWTLKLENLQLRGLQRYFYAFYFASTTMLTIGYGDLSPTNELEILAILPIQVIGVAVFSYIISEIGYTVNSVRKGEEELEKNLSILSKMNDFYKMDSEVLNNAKSSLLSNQKSFDNVYPEDENAVMSKLSDDLRETMTFQNGLNIVKSSIFFLCHWTKQFQSEIAKSLIKKILNPNEVLHQEFIKTGKLEVFTNCTYNYRQQFKRLLKTISPKNSQEVSDNVYGYTSMLSNRPVRLLATSKEFTTVYEIAKDKFLSCVNSNNLDWEYFHQMKSRIDTSGCAQSFETPAVLSIRFHYRPSEFYVIKKFKYQINKKDNKRSSFQRKKRRVNIAYSWQKYEFKSSNQLTNRSLKINSKTSKQETKIKNHKTETQQYLNPKDILHNQFQTIKQYENFFKKNNFTSILIKYELSYFKTPKNKEQQIPSMFFSMLKVQESQESI